MAAINRRASGHRPARVGEVLRHALAEILARGEIADADIAGRTITVAEVRMSPDLRHGVVYVCPLGGDDGAAVIAGLVRARHHLNAGLARRVRLKCLPRLEFRLDESFDEASHIDRLLRAPVVARDLDCGPGEDPA